MAGLRLRDLCDRLNINDEDIRKKIWTCFENSLIQHTDLMRDRHLDQIIMCAFYAICKVTKQSQTFQEIMKCYRLQPQAASHVSIFDNLYDYFYIIFSSSLLLGLQKCSDEFSAKTSTLWK